MSSKACAVAALSIGGVSAFHASEGGVKRPTLKWVGANGRERTGRMRAPRGGYPQCDPTVKQISGYFDIQASTDKHYFYWGFESKRNPAKDPVILWMTGGPGCSSILAMLGENGPCGMDEKTGEMTHNPYSWNNVATVIYIDQPAGVGFSYGDKSGYDHNETEVGDDMYRFFQAFYAAYPQYLKNDLFIYGESFGGHYAPATAARVLKGNQAGEGTHIPLKGLSVGNGLTDDTIQYKYYPELAYDWCIVVNGKPCISQEAKNASVAAWPECERRLKACNGPKNKDCIAARNFCDEHMSGPYTSISPRLNVYNIAAPCNGPLCYDFSKITAFLNEDEVKKALGVDSHIKWQTCNYEVNGMFAADWAHDMQGHVAALLDADIRVMIYAGDFDYVCNWIGNKAWTIAFPWKNHAAFEKAPDSPWYHDAKAAGRFRTVSSAANKMQFTFLQVYAAGHMVPMDQPSAALNMVEHFTSDTPFNTIGN